MLSATIRSNSAAAQAVVQITCRYASAVRRFVDEPPDPEAIRADALRRLRFFRTALAETVCRFTGKLPFDPYSVDGAWFTRHFVAVQFWDDYLKSYAKGGFERSDLLGQFA